MIQSGSILKVGDFDWQALTTLYTHTHILYTGSWTDFSSHICSSLIDRCEGRSWMFGQIWDRGDSGDRRRPARIFGPWKPQISESAVQGPDRPADLHIPKSTAACFTDPTYSSGTVVLQDDKSTRGIFDCLKICTVVYALTLHYKILNEFIYWKSIYCTVNWSPFYIWAVLQLTLIFLWCLAHENCTCNK